MLNAITSPKISIIMPTFNRAAFILETIESIRNQTHQNWELIIIDDGSDDDTGTLIAGIKDDRIQFHKAGRTGSISKIRMMGIEKASADLIAFIDSDDLWAATKLEEQVTALQQNTAAGFCLTGGYNFREPGIPIDHFYKQKEGIKYGPLFISFFNSELSSYIQALMFRKECLTVAGPFKETENEVEFILRLARNFNGIILYKPLLFRRIHDISDSNSNWEKNYHEGINIIRANKTNIAPGIVRDSFFRLYINFGEDCFRNNEHKKAIQNFLKAWMNKPFSVVPFKKTGKVMLQYFKNQ